MKWTAHENIAVRHCLAPKSQSGAAIHYGTGVLRTNFQEALVILSLGTMAGGSTYDVKVQESDDDSTYTDVTSAAFAQKVAATHASKTFVGRLNLIGRKKYIRIAGTDAVGAVLSCGIIVLLSPKVRPVTLEQTIGFNV